MNKTLKISLWREIGEHRAYGAFHGKTISVYDYGCHYIVGDVANVIPYINNLFEDKKAQIDKNEIYVIDDSSETGNKLQKIFDAIFVPLNNEAYNYFCIFALTTIAGEKSHGDHLIDIKKKDLENIVKEIERVHAQNLSSLMHPLEKRKMECRMPICPM